jgi:DNA-directed RNA polymerase subunit N (RpoN/RPB10)
MTDKPANRFVPHPPRGYEFHCYKCGEHFSARWDPGDNVRCPHCGQDWTTDYDSGLKPIIVRAVEPSEALDDDEQTWEDTSTP